MPERVKLTIYVSRELRAELRSLCNSGPEEFRVPVTTFVERLIERALKAKEKSK